MAIAFARCEFVKRSAGHHAVNLSAYLSCSLVEDENTGRVYGREWLKHADSVVHNQMLAPEGASQRFAAMSPAWSCVERSERRSNSVVALHIVAALDPSLSRADWIRQAEEFARRHWVSNGVVVQYAIHNPHPHAATDRERENPHIHYEVMTRRVEGDHLCRLKARDLMPIVRRIFGRGHVVEADAWGKLWGEYQDEDFKRRGLSLRVDPIGQHPQEHTGPRRRLRKDDPRVLRNEIRRALNLGERMQDLAHKARDAAAHVDKVPSRWRPLTIEDVARQLSSAYAQARSALYKARDEADLTRRALNRAEQDQAVAEYRVRERRQELGIIRESLHDATKWRPHMGLLRRAAYRFGGDAELDQWQSRYRGAGKRVVQEKHNLQAAESAVAAAERELDHAFAAIEPLARAELDQRQRIARTARRHAVEEVAEGLRRAQSISRA